LGGSEEKEDKKGRAKGREKIEAVRGKPSFFFKHALEP
jgi:hypothetical protein